MPKKQATVPEPSLRPAAMPEQVEFAARDAFLDKVRLRLIELGVSPVWAVSLIEADQPWLFAQWQSVTVEVAAREVFSPEIAEDLNEYRNGIAWMLDQFTPSVEAANAMVAAEMATVAQAHRNKLHPWFVALQLLHKTIGGDVKIIEVPAQAPIQQANRDTLRITPEPEVLKMIDQVVKLGLLGQTRQAVATQLIHQGLLGLLRDRVITQ